MRLLSILLAFVLLLSGCNSRQASEVVPTYNPYVEAFTTGKISRFAPVYLILSQDLPEGADLTGKLKLTPEVEGTWTAENKRTLTFRPAQSFDYATTYRVDADLSDWFETDKDEARFAFSFSTYAFAIRGYQSGLDVSVANEDSLDVHYVLQTSDREMPERVEKLVSYPLGRAVWQHSPDGRRHELTLCDVPKKENGYTLDVTGKGEEAEDLSISLMIPAKGDFSVFDVRYVSEPERYVEITFTYSLDETQQLEGLAYLEGNTSKVVEVDGNKLRLFPDADAAILCAAVADFTVEATAASKIKRRGDSLDLRLVPTRDIAAALGEMKRPGQRIAGFALETDNERSNARDKLLRKNFDFIVLNSLNDPGAGFMHDTNKINIITRNEEKAFPLKPKTEVARDIVDNLCELFNS